MYGLAARAGKRERERRGNEPGNQAERRRATSGEAGTPGYPPVEAPPVALTVAGSDSGGGAGIQADLKTFHAFRVFGTSAVTAVTAQNTSGIVEVQRIEAPLVRCQIESVWEDLNPAAIKTGMLVDEAILRSVADALRMMATPAIVVDPVIEAASGRPLLEQAAIGALRTELVPLASLITPNLPEAERLIGAPVRDVRQMRRAARRIHGLGAGAVLLTGGHLAGPEVVDVLFDGARWHVWRNPRIRSSGGHGTGCTLSAAIAAGLAWRRELVDAVDEAIRFVREGLGQALPIGRGTGPLNHWVHPRPETGV